MQEEELSLLRTKDLKTLLLQLGVHAKEISKRVDKKELIALALSQMHEKQSDNERIIRNERLRYAAIAVVLLLICLLMWSTIMNVLTSLAHTLFGEYFLFSEKFRLIKKAYKYSLFAACLALIFSCGIDIYIPLLNMSTLLSWCVGHESILRSYMLPSFQFPLSLKTITGRGSGDTGLNIGPMVTMMGLRFFKARLDDYAAKRILMVSNDRRAQRVKEKTAETFYENLGPDSKQE